MSARPNLPADLGNLLNDVLRRLRALETAPRLRNSSISDGGLVVRGGGGLTVGGGSAFTVEAPDGTEVIRAGLQPNGDYGITMSRQDGTLAARIANPFTGDPGGQVVELYDRAGGVLVGDTAFAASGAGAPSLDHVFVPVVSRVEQATASASFTDLYEWRGRKHNAYLRPRFIVRCSDATTAGEVQVVDRLNGDAGLYGFFQPAWVGAVAAGTDTDTELLPPYALLLPGNVGFDCHLVIQGRVTAGAGTLSVSVSGVPGAAA